MGSSFGYTDLNACTAVPDNQTYLSNIHYGSSSNTPSGSTVGIMMILSTLQFQGSMVNPTYSDMASKIGKAAYIESGGQAFQDKLAPKVESGAKGIAHSIGITDTEMAVVLGAAKIYKEKQIKIRGPKIGPIKTDLTATPKSGILGIKYEW